MKGSLLVFQEKLQKLRRVLPCNLSEQFLSPDKKIGTRNCTLIFNVWYPQTDFLKAKSVLDIVVWYKRSDSKCLLC